MEVTEKRIGRPAHSSNTSTLVWKLINDHFGGYCNKAAEHFGVSRQAVNAWVHRGWIPPIHALMASVASGQSITTEQFLQEYMQHLHSKVQSKAVAL